MKIGELARCTGLTTSKIRFYEDIGLLKNVRRQANGYRSYPAQAEIVLNLIIQGQKAGFSLDELRALLPANLDNWQHGKLVDALEEKLTDIDAMQKRLADNKKQLVNILAQIKAKPEDVDCATNAKRVISQIGTSQLSKAKSRSDRNLE